MAPAAVSTRYSTAATASLSRAVPRKVSVVLVNRVLADGALMATMGGMASTKLASNTRFDSMTKVSRGRPEVMPPVQPANLKPADGLAVMVLVVPTQSSVPSRLGLTVPSPWTCTVNGLGGPATTRITPTMPCLS